MIDILVPTVLLPLVEWEGTPDAVDTARAAATLGFTGVELATTIGVPARTVAAWQQKCTPTTAVEALRYRGALVVTEDGFAGVTVGASRVVEPAGRVWALTTATPGRYVWAGFCPGVQYTLEKP